MEDLGSIVLSEDDVPGANFKSTPETYNREQLKRWLKCHGMKVGGRKPELVERVRQCIAMKIGVDPGVDQGKWYEAKQQQQRQQQQQQLQLQGGSKITTQFRIKIMNEWLSQFRCVTPRWIAKTG